MNSALKSNLFVNDRRMVLHSSCDTTFDSNLEHLSEKEFMKDAPPIEYERRPDPSQAFSIYQTHKKRLLSISKSQPRRRKSELCLTAVKTHVFILKL